MTKPSTDSAPLPRPRLSYLLATAFGLGRLPKAPGTWGSLGGLFLSAALLKLWPHQGLFHVLRASPVNLPFVFPAILLFLLVALCGVAVSSRVAAHSGIEDPQYVVIDEVSGQMIPLLFAITTSFTWLQSMEGFPTGFWWHGGLNWTWLLLGFLLFRAFDIWKPWPVRKLEKLPSGWGIMADDWMAGLYAALVLRLVIHLGLL